jgi:hypothetical protein
MSFNNNKLFNIIYIIYNNTMTEFDFGEIFYKKDLCYSIDNKQDYFFISADYNHTTSV